MSVQLLTLWNGIPAGTIVSPGAATEAALVAQFIAKTDLTGGLRSSAESTVSFVGDYPTLAALQQARPRVASGDRANVVDPATGISTTYRFDFSIGSTGTWVQAGGATAALGPYANATALQAGAPAASNAGKTALVGASAPYAIYSSDGSVWNAPGTATITPGSVTNTQLANMPANTVKLNNTGAAASPIDATVTQVKTLLAYAVADVSGAAPTANPTFTGTVAGVTAAMVGLGNVNNTADSAKPVSTLQAAAIATVPQNSQSAAYTLVAADAGKHILHPSADTTAETFTIPANSSVAFPIGTAITFVNQNAGGTVTIAITTDTMRLAGAGTTGSRTLAANGIATALKLTATEWIISGTNLT